MRKFWKNEKGGIAIYAAMFAVVGIGAGAVAIDFGRLELLRNEMQSAADAAALAAVVHLDGRDGAIGRAKSVADDASSHYSAVPKGGGVTELTIKTKKVYAEYKPAKVDTNDDLEAKFIEVEMQPQEVQLMFAPVLQMLSGGGAGTSTLEARAVAGIRPYLCHAPPLMMCDLAEGDPTIDLTHPDNPHAGQQLALKEPVAGGGTWAPGNFGLLALPDGSAGAVDIEKALAAEVPQDCYRIDIITATGSKTIKVQNGINARFDISPLPDPPAPNVVNYPQDDDIIADPNVKLGSGIFDIATYWTEKHDAAPFPPDLVNASRYQLYLYELGLTYARGLINPKKTLYPVPGGGAPADYEVIVPPGPDLAVANGGEDPTLPDFDGVPQNAPAANGYARRLVQVALLQCIAEGVNGKGTYPTNGLYVEMFITQEVRDAPDGGIYGEIVRPLTTLSNPEFHANAYLVE